jgi:hypothetical protein
MLRNRHCSSAKPVAYQPAKLGVNAGWLLEIKQTLLVELLENEEYY